MSKAIPSREEDYSLWYNEIIKKADLAENSPVRGCMVIKPYGFAIWEKIHCFFLLLLTWYLLMIHLCDELHF